MIAKYACTSLASLPPGTYLVGTTLPLLFSLVRAGPEREQSFITRVIVRTGLLLPLPEHGLSLFLCSLRYLENLKCVGGSLRKCIAWFTTVTQSALLEVS